MYILVAESEISVGLGLSFDFLGRLRRYRISRLGCGISLYAIRLYIRYNSMSNLGRLGIVLNGLGDRRWGNRGQERLFTHYRWLQHGLLESLS